MGKRMNVDPNSGVAQSYLIGQLSRSINTSQGFGALLLKGAIELISKAKELVGCRIVRVDCSDDLVSYYERNGFRWVSKNEEKGLNQMVRFIDYDDGANESDCLDEIRSFCCVF